MKKTSVIVLSLFVPYLSFANVSNHKPANHYIYCPGVTLTCVKSEGQQKCVTSGYDASAWHMTESHIAPSFTGHQPLVLNGVKASDVREMGASNKPAECTYYGQGSQGMVAEVFLASNTQLFADKWLGMWQGPYAKENNQLYCLSSGIATKCPMQLA